MAVRKPDLPTISALFLIKRGFEQLAERLEEVLDSVDGIPDPEPLPSHVPSEIAILGAIMLDNAEFSKAKTLDPDDFSLDSHRHIFTRMAELIEAGSAADIVTIAEALGANKERESIGGTAYLAYLTEGLPRQPVIVDYIRIVKEKAALRKLILVCTTAIARAQEPGETAIGIRKWMSEQFNAKKVPRP